MLEYDDDVMLLQKSSTSGSASSSASLSLPRSWLTRFSSPKSVMWGSGGASLVGLAKGLLTSLAGVVASEQGAKGGLWEDCQIERLGRVGGLIGETGRSRGSMGWAGGKWGRCAGGKL